MIKCVSHLTVSDSLGSHGLQPTRLLCPGDFPDENTGVCCHSLLQGIFPMNQGKLEVVKQEVGKTEHRHFRNQ